MTKLIIFDLDGTLLNTIGDLAASCNNVLARHNLPQYNYQQYATFIGKGVKNLVKRAIPEEMHSNDFIDEIYSEFIQHYKANMTVNTVPYSGITELLTLLSAREDILLAVASNKFQEGTAMLVDHFFKDINFAIVSGNRKGVALKPDPAVANNILDVTSISAEDALFVGDSGEDMLTAKRANIRSIGVTWGFRDRVELLENGASCLIDSPMELLDIL